MFYANGEVNKVLNQFAKFVWERKSLCESTEKRFVKKLRKLSGSTNSPMSLLMQRIDNNEVFGSLNSIAKQGVLEDMIYAIKKHDS